MINVEWLHDESECDTCGSNYAQGAIVSLDGEEIIRLEPHASCFGTEDWSAEEVMIKIINYLGHEVRSI